MPARKESSFGVHSALICFSDAVSDVNQDEDLLTVLSPFKGFSAAFSAVKWLLFTALSPRKGFYILLQVVLCCTGLSPLKVLIILLNAVFYRAGPLLYY